MIYYLTNERNTGLMQAFVSGWGRALADAIAIVPYERLIGERRLRLPPGTYIFTSLGRTLGSREPLSAARQWAMRLHAHLLERNGPDRVLNDPGRTLPRLGLLRALADAGINRFRAYRAGDRDPRMRFPVFLRDEHGTVWEPPALLPSHDVYEAQLARGERPGQVAIEHCDTRDASGVYRKYGAFVVGRRIVPRHLFFSRNWLVKAADIVDQDRLAEELGFLTSNPHEEALLRACRLANISYGRIDYALLDGVPQVWEINTTPQIVVAPGKDAPERAVVHARFAAAFTAALQAIDPRPA